MQPGLQDHKQDIINRLNQVNNILVTVKSNPTVDELSAALGLTMALNNYGKHATAVFSGQIPNAMSFLKPQKTFENNVHSLRDFIISLNKEKADKLRFAKDGEIVKIYITPYKSTITPTDLEYSEGDFNVEMVIAVGINVKEELDAVIAAHGRILHEATVATVMPGQTPSQLGSINWSDSTVTSSSAMAVQLIQNLNVPNLLSPEVATALLTGIVADTDRFSNSKTSPRVMEISAQLMNAGANHLLVTSSIAASTHTVTPNQAAPVPQTQTETDQQNQELILDLHSSNPISTSTSTPTPLASSPLEPTSGSTTNPPATNTSPMVSSAPVESPNTQDSQPPLAVPSPSPAVADLLPKPADASQTVVPADLLPPQPSSTSTPQVEPTPAQPLPPSSQINTPPQSSKHSVPEAQAPLAAQDNTKDKSINNSGADQIRSEIDKIYGAEPFDPANNPRQDVATNIAITDEPAQDQALKDPQITDSSNLFVDTSVQSAQSASQLRPIEATKDEKVDVNSILGESPTQEVSSTKPDQTANSTGNLPEIPGLEMPPEITPPPPPPNPLLNTPKTSSIDNEPFGNTLNFDPTKPTENAK